MDDQQDQGGGQQPGAAQAPAKQAPAKKAPAKKAPAKKAPAKKAPAQAAAQQGPAPGAAAQQGAASDRIELLFAGRPRANKKLSKRFKKLEKALHGKPGRVRGRAEPANWTGQVTTSEVYNTINQAHQAPTPRPT